jgi:hypothetical protein
MPKHAKHTKASRDEGMLRGLHELGPKLLYIRGGPGLDTVDAIVARYRAHLAAMAEVAEKEIAWRLAVERERALEVEILAIHARVVLGLRAQFGSRSAQLRRFGLRPARVPKISAETKRRAVERRLETRRLRGTLGKKQRKRIKAKGG